MKKFILYFLSLFAMSASAQHGNPFKLDHVEWNILSCSWSGGPPYVYYFNHYRLCGDTIYQGHQYKRIFEGTASWYPPVMGMTPSKPYPQPANYGFYGFFREDSVLKRTYLRMPSWSADSLLMDYDLQVGDTVKRGHYYQTELNGPTPGPSPLKIISEDSIPVNGRKFRVLYTDSGGQLYNASVAAGYFFIEGLGHINGVFEYWAAQEYYSRPFENCVGVDTVIFNCDCSHLSGMSTPEELKIEIYPVPAATSVKLGRKINGTIIISSTLGQKILEISCNGCDEIDLGNLEEGIYFLEFNEPGERYLKRIIKD